MKSPNSDILLTLHTELALRGLWPYDNNIYSMAYASKYWDAAALIRTRLNLTSTAECQTILRKLYIQTLST